ncbi:hypothetical protein BP6252_05113 [Coleophoma cylindrospora]|uniref:BTB domain-containing protein n=1 Tax=Coleophoma cylindrospora TaxID=1849047 RepID=A0A3D8RSX9_9HELO|nr:hypothetical protein BP6252_05113 [Coleophoma cylindrospora]
MSHEEMTRSVYPDLEGVTFYDNATVFGQTSVDGTQHDVSYDDELLIHGFNNASIVDETSEATNHVGDADVAYGGAQQNGSSLDPIVPSISEHFAEEQQFNEFGMTEAAPVIIFVVDGESVQFPVRLELACRHSPMINEHFSNDVDLEIFTINDTTVEAMRLLVYYFENAELDLSRPGDEDYTLSAEDKKKIRDQHDINLVNLYILAGNFRMPKLQNWVICNLYTLHNDGVPMSPATIPMIYGFKDPEKIINLKALLLNQYTWGRPWELNIDFFPTEMVFDMISKLHGDRTEEVVSENYFIYLPDYYLPMDFE